MSRWFRMHDEILDDPKVQRLSGDDFKGWVNLLCLASRNNGKLPSIDDVAFALRETEESVSSLFHRLQSAGLIVLRNGRYEPYRWAERQYKSDTSTDRVKRFRQRSRNGGETAPDTEAETDSSVDKSTGGEPPADPLKELFDVGVAIFTASGCTEKQARSLIGKYRKAKSDAEVLTALLDCRRLAITNPVEWMEKRFQGGKWVSKSGYEYRGTDEQVLREAERRNDMNTYWAVKAAMKAAA